MNWRQSPDYEASIAVPPGRARGGMDDRSRADADERAAVVPVRPGRNSGHFDQGTRHRDRHQVDLPKNVNTGN